LIRTASAPHRCASNHRGLWDLYLRARRREHRDLLVEGYLPLVRVEAVRVAARLPRTVDPDDLMSAGCYGLLQSIEHFDPARGVRFETFSRARIRGAMLDELRTQDILSRDARDRSDRIAEARRRLTQELGRDPAPSEIAALLGLSAREIDLLSSEPSKAPVLSIEGALREDEPSYSSFNWIEEQLVDSRLDPPALAHQKDLLLLIQECLTGDERRIVVYHYRDGMTMRRIGRRLGVSESRISQIHSRLLHRLQRRIAAAEG